MPYIGGAEILFDNVVRGLMKEGNRVTVLTSKFNKNLPKYEKREDGVEIYRVGHNRYDFMLYALGRRGIQLAKEADIIHTTTYNAAIPAKILSILTRKKIMITIHEIFGKNWTKFMGPIGIFYRFVESCILTIPYHKILCVSNATKKSLIDRGIPENKLVTIHNGIDYTIWDPRNIDNNQVNTIRETYDLSEYFVGLFFGRPGISKGLEYFIRAMPSIISNIPHFKAFLLVSKNDQSRYAYVKDLARELGLEKYVLWKDSVSYKEIINYIAMADFTIIPSLAEGFGFAAVEAATIGKPIVVSNVGSLPEVVSGKVALAIPGDANDIASKIYEVYQGHYETIPVKIFSREDNIQKTLSVCREVIGK